MTPDDILRALEGLECYERCTGLRSVVAPILRDRLAKPVAPSDGKVLMAMIDDYAKAVHDGDDAACVVLRRTLEASMEQLVPAPVPLTDERLRFEEWLHSQHIDVPRLCDAGSYRAGEYESTDIEDWWAVWQARAAHGIGGER